MRIVQWFILVILYLENPQLLSLGITIVRFLLQQEYELSSDFVFLWNVCRDANDSSMLKLKLCFMNDALSHMPLSVTSLDFFT